jgi:tetratricopeptide (TPR) repeat protein
VGLLLCVAVSAQSTPQRRDSISASLDLNKANLPQKSSIPREQRSRALALIASAQRSMMQMATRNQSVFSANANSARDQLLESVRLDPTNSEVYTALSDLSQLTTPYDYNDSERLARFALELNPESPGALRTVSRILVIRSEISSTLFNEQVAKEAIVYLQRITKIDPRNAEAWAFLSELFGRLAMPDDRIKALEGWVASASPIDDRFFVSVIGQGADLSPESASMALAEAYLDRGLVREALERLNAVINGDPNDSDALGLLQEALEIADSASAKNAVVILEQALFVNPENVTLAVALSRVLYRNGRIEEGSRVLDRLIAKSDPGSERELQLRIFKADLLSEVAEYDRATALLLEILGKDPGGVSRDYENFESMVRMEVFRKLIAIEKASGRFDQVPRLISNYRWVFPSTDSFPEEERVRVMVERGDFKGAARELATVKKRFNGKDFSGLEILILTRQGKANEAISVFSSAEDGKSERERRSDFASRMMVVSILIDSGARERSVSYAEKAFEAASSDEERTIAKLALASAHRRSGNLERAISIAEESLLMSPDNPMAMNNLGFMLLEADREIDRATTLIRRAIRIDPRNSAYLDSLGLAYIRRGNPDLALEKLRRALALNPVSVAVLEHLGDAFMAKGDRVRSLEYWRRAVSVSWDKAVQGRLKSKIDKSGR